MCVSVSVSVSESESESESASASASASESECEGDVGGRVDGFQMLLYELPETKNATWAGYSLVGLLPLPVHPHLAHFFICIGPQRSCRILFCGPPCFVLLVRVLFYQRASNGMRKVAAG